MSELSLAPLDPAEVPAVLALLEASGLPTEGIEENPTAFVVARLGDELVGCCGLEIHGAHGLLRSLVVDPRYRGRGIAKALVDHVLSLPRQQATEGTYLLTTTARDFFPRFGFEIRPRDHAPEAIRASWEFRAGCPDTAVCMFRPPAAIVRDDAENL